jgi:hypothetical protein
MRSFTAVFLIALGISVAGSGKASAQAAFSVNVAAGHQVRALWTYSINPDCTSLGPIVVRITQAPQQGRVSIRNDRAFPNFPNSNVRNVCNARRVPGVAAYYQAASGYVGFDSISFDVIFPSGSYRQYTTNIQVR